MMTPDHEDREPWLVDDDDEEAISPEAVEAAGRHTLSFGKHRGRTLAWVASCDVLYLDWLAGVTLQSPALREAVGLLCRHHEAAIDRAMERRAARGDKP